MNLTSIRPGDIVVVDDGLPFYALVKDRQPRQLSVEPLAGTFHPKPVKARDVKSHWRKAGRA